MNWDYEKAEREMLFSLAKDGDTFFDIGANEGLYSISFAKQFPRSKVYAFEPIPQMRQELNRNLGEIKNVFIYAFGLSDHTGFVDFYFSESDPGATSLAPLEERFGPTITMKKLVTTLDEQCSAPHPCPNIIKCDVEGAELLVFKGGAHTLEKYQPIIQCEMLRKWAKRFNYHPNEIIAFLGQFGYQCFSLRDRKLERFETMTEETTETNFYFLPRRIA